MTCREVVWCRSPVPIIYLDCSFLLWETVVTEEPLETVASSVCCMYRDSLCRECSVLVFFSFPCYVQTLCVTGSFVHAGVACWRVYSTERQ